MTGKADAGQWKILIVGSGVFVAVLGLTVWFLARDARGGDAPAASAGTLTASAAGMDDRVPPGPGTQLPGGEAPGRTVLPPHVQRHTGFAIINKSPLRMEEERKWAEMEASGELDTRPEEGSEEEPPDIE